MTKQEKRDYLLRYRDGEREAERLAEELRRWESRAQRVTVAYHDAPAGGTGESRLQLAVERIEALRLRLCQQLATQAALYMQVEDSIYTVQEKKLRLVLCYYFLEGLTWEQVAKKMGNSRQHVERLYLRGLDKIWLP